MSNNERNLQVDLGGLVLKNPVTVASGTFGFGGEFSKIFDLSLIGGISVKGLTLKPRLGNISPRITETYGGMINSVGLENPGVEEFVDKEIPFLSQYDVKIIANINGNSIDEYVEMARILDDTAVHSLEINISCPNVKHGGVHFGTNPEMVEAVTRAVRKATNKHIIVKLSPNVTDIVQIASAAERGGANAVSLINTLMGMKIDINTRKPLIGNVMGGFSGPAIKPVAIRMVYQVKKALNIPILGLGGIMNGDDAIEMMIAGATAIATGTANMIDPYAPIKTLKGIEDYMDSHGVNDINEIIGSVRV
jgi:dihydroorotate dehydrogenase (NAD+) catalytic subunit